MGKSSWRCRALISAFAFCILSVHALADVSVRGYYRSNGTYVQPHHRSSPDGNFGNNWSTYGNRNPYTGKWGTRRTPPAGYGGTRGSVAAESGGGVDESVYAPMKPEKPKITAEERKAQLEERKKREEERRSAFAVELQARGIPVEGRTAAELQHAKFKLAMADSLERHGIVADSEKMKASELYGLKNQITLSKELSGYGYSVELNERSSAELTDTLFRMKLARYIENAQPGRHVQWEDYSAAELSKMSAEAADAR